MKSIDAERAARGFENTAEQLEKQAAALMKLPNPEEAVKWIYVDSSAATIKAAAKTLREDVPEVTAFPAWRNPETDPPKVEEEVLIMYQTASGGCGITTAHYEDGTLLSQDSIFYWDELAAWGELDEENNDYIIPKGWWEYRHFNQDEVYNNRVDYPVIGWMPLPPKEVKK